MGEHTSGPWVAEPADMFGDHNIVLAEGDDRRAIAAVVSNMRPEREVAANARLIAAAPDLLAVAKEMVASEWSYMSDADLSEELSLGNEMVRNTIAARAAIAKATGASS